MPDRDTEGEFFGKMVDIITEMERLNKNPPMSEREKAFFDYVISVFVGDEDKLKPDA